MQRAIGCRAVAINIGIVVALSVWGCASDSEAVLTYTVTPTLDDLLGVTPQTVQTVNSGATASFTVEHAAGFIPAPTVGGTCPAGTWSGSVYTTGLIVEDCTVIFTAIAARGLYLTAIKTTAGNSLFNADMLRVTPDVEDTSTRLAQFTFGPTYISYPYATIDQPGHLYISDGYRTIYKRPRSGSNVVYATSDLFFSPYTMKFDHAGNLYVVNQFVNSTFEGEGPSSNWAVMKVTPDGVVSGFIAGSDALGDMVRPYGLAMDANGNFYLSDNETGIIRKYQPDGTGVTQFASAVQGATAMAFDTSGTLYVGSARTFSTQNGIIAITPEGVATRYAELETSSPMDLALDPATNTLYVVCFASFFSPGTPLKKITSDGTVTTINPTITSDYTRINSLTWLADP